MKVILVVIVKAYVAEGLPEKCLFSGFSSVVERFIPRSYLTLNHGHYCHDVLLRKKIRPLIPPRKGAQYWTDKYGERNHAVANQRLSGSNDVWKKKVGYHRRSVAETAMYRFKTLLGAHLSLRNYDAQVGEAMAMVKALNRMTLLGMPHSARIG